ncbi:MAG: ZIP family metal transporter [Persephonella sp.]|nr:MAG: ZIP family metal transporter [Persephonella sp.]RUM59042.1 MAG: ZIP family metal transporter [Persephonella sp.]
MENPYLLGFLGSLLAGLATVLGAFFVIFKQEISEKFRDISLGFSAGIMLSASFFSLLSPSIEILNELLTSKLLIALTVSFGFILGTVVFWIADIFISDDYIHKYLTKNKESSINLKKLWLFTLAITIHNFPEGMSSALGFLTGNIGNGLAVATGIGIQNIPEGLAVALPLLISAGYSKKFAIFITFLTGIVEPIGGLVGMLTFGFYNLILPIGLSFAAGAMIFVISKEIIPETHRRGFEKEATTGLILGFILMMFLDVALG